MKIIDFLSKDAVKISLDSTAKKQVLEELVDQLVKARKIKKDINIRGRIVKSLIERERAGSTGIGQGIAIPHAKSDKIKNVIIAFGNSMNGVEFNSLDGEPAYVIFLMIAPRKSSGLHLKVLAKISRLLKDKFFRLELKDAKTPEDVIKIIEREDL